MHAHLRRDEPEVKRAFFSSYVRCAPLTDGEHGAYAAQIGISPRASATHYR